MTNPRSLSVGAGATPEVVDTLASSIQEACSAREAVRIGERSSQHATRAVALPPGSSGRSEEIPATTWRRTPGIVL